MRPDEEERASAGELVKFMILVAIMLLIVLLVAASRPFIFQRLVPAVLGWGTPAAEEVSPVIPALSPSPSLATPAAPEDPVGAGDAMSLEAASPAPTVTALPTATPQTYQVQPGDNLTTIARRFGLSAEALASANGLTNPDRIRPGDVLIIPSP